MRPMRPIAPPRPAPGDAIPRQIFQTYPRERLTPELRRNISGLIAANPGWSHRLFDDEEARAFIRSGYGRGVVELYDRIGEGYGAARADLFRYLLMYREGGVYLDVKSSFKTPIDAVVKGEDSFVISQWRNGEGEPHQGWGLHPELAQVPGGEFQQWHIIAAPGHPFLRAVIERVLGGIESYSARSVDVGWAGVLRLTGPIAYTLAIAPLLDRHPHRRVADESELNLDYSIFAGSDHKSLFAKHYTTNLAPVVRQPGLRGWRDRLYLEGRKRRKQWRERFGGALSESR